MFCDVQINPCLLDQFRVTCTRDFTSPSLSKSFTEYIDQKWLFQQTENWDLVYYITVSTEIFKNQLNICIFELIKSKNLSLNFTYRTYSGGGGGILLKIESFFQKQPVKIQVLPSQRHKPDARLFLVMYGLHLISFQQLAKFHDHSIL